jgi:hypothetical protein
VHITVLILVDSFFKKKLDMWIPGASVIGAKFQAQFCPCIDCVMAVTVPESSY